MAAIYLNVAVSGLLTGLVYGLMALGLSVIFGVVRVVNFAHGEMMTIAMYVAIVAFNTLGLDPLVMAVPLAAVLFALGYALQAGLINPFINRPEHSQFILLVALALIIVNVLLIVFGPDAHNVQTSYAYDSFAFGPLIVYATGVIAANILFEAGLSYLGLGVPPPTASWGQMLSDGVSEGLYRVQPWLALIPGIALASLMLSFQLLGDGLRDALATKSAG